MSSRDAILNKVRHSLGRTEDDAARQKAVAGRLKKAPLGVIPARGQLGARERVELFHVMAEKLYATVERLKKPDDVPKAVAAYLRGKNLPASLRMGGDPRLAAMPWAKQRALEVKSGPSDGDDMTGVSHAMAGIAETGTLVLHSGPANPTTINFLPEHHIVVIDVADIDGDLEAAISSVRKKFGKGKMPRTMNLISGPSRSGDIEQKLILGAHGPRALHIIVVGA
ncbi:MAG: lactate utilization protein [Pseudaminobacter sp.]|nr:lactate utilization protein [Pseudaminobacter sp.]